MNVITYILVSYALVINIIGFSIMGIDKSRARNQKWRIKEKTLFLVATVGGSLGSILGMYCFHHKTKHKSFVITMPIILCSQIFLIIILTLAI